jgi:hypothetical protein
VDTKLQTTSPVLLVKLEKESKDSEARIILEEMPKGFPRVIEPRRRANIRIGYLGQVLGMEKRLYKLNSSRGNSFDLKLNLLASFLTHYIFPLWKLFRKY